MANFVDLNEINKKVIEGNLPRSLLRDIRSTQRSKIAQNKSNLGLKLNSIKNTISIPHFEDLVETNKKVIQSDLLGSLLCGIRAPERSKIAQNRSKIGL